jgi:hypothetical protein
VNLNNQKYIKKIKNNGNNFINEYMDILINKNLA